MTVLIPDLSELIQTHPPYRGGQAAFGDGISESARNEIHFEGSHAFGDCAPFPELPCPMLPEEQTIHRRHAEKSGIGIGPLYVLPDYWFAHLGYVKKLKPGYLGLIVDKEARKIWREGSLHVVDFSRSKNQWYCFRRIFRSGEAGVAPQILQAGYPGKKDYCRQAVYDMSKNVKCLGIVMNDGRSGSWRFLSELSTNY